MELSKDYLLLQLYRANPTEETLKALALYIRTFKGQYEMIVDGITYVHSKTSIHHHLLLYYLINEILYTEHSSAGAPLCKKLREFLSSNLSADIEASGSGSIIHRKLVSLKLIWEGRGISGPAESKTHQQEK